jgi:hypothetical protein
MLICTPSILEHVVSLTGLKADPTPSHDSHGSYLTSYKFNVYRTERPIPAFASTCSTKVELSKHRSDTQRREIMIDVTITQFYRIPLRE